MKYYIIAILLILTSCTPTKKTIVEEETQNMESLLRLGYDYIDHQDFTTICNALNDSIQKQTWDLEMSSGYSVNYIDSTVDWFFAHIDHSTGSYVRRDFDIFYCYMDLDKDHILKADQIPLELNQIPDFINECIFNPDTTYWDLITKEIEISETQKIRKSCKILYFSVSAKDNFSICDWHFFFNCLHKIIDAYTNKQEQMALRLWNKEYQSLSFKQKEKLIHIVPFSISIRFY